MVAILLLAQQSQAATCKQFVCKSFDKGPNDVCVSVNTTESSNQLVRKCDSKKVCTALAWFKVEDAAANATCTDVPTPPEITNMTLPGDSCSKASECFGLANETSCSTVCSTKRGDGQYCENTGTGADVILGTKWCAVGFYCDTTAKKCTAQKKEGDVCTAGEQCPSNLGCIKQGTDTDFKCTKWWSLADGTKFDSTNIQSRGFLTTKDACKTHHYITPDAAKPTQLECRKATKGDYTTLDQLKRPDGPSNDCKFTKYEDPADKDKAQPGQDTAKCGFNKGSAAYCDKRKGDSWFQDVLKKAQGLNLSGLKCHALSGLEGCGSAQTTIGKDLFKKWTRELLSTDEGLSGWALYADNDNCVATSMTGEYWQGDSPDFAFGSFTTSSFATVVLTICALFYMF